MADVFTKAKRSAVMSLICSRGNRATEHRLIALMREHGITGWRRNAKVFGKPDFIPFGSDTPKLASAWLAEWVEW